MSPKAQKTGDQIRAEALEQELLVAAKKYGLAISPEEQMACKVDLLDAALLWAAMKAEADQ